MSQELELQDQEELMLSFARKMQNLIDEAAHHGIVLRTENVQALPPAQRPAGITDTLIKHRILAWDEKPEHPYLERAEFVRASCVYATTVPMDQVLEMRGKGLDFNRPSYSLQNFVRE